MKDKIIKRLKDEEGGATLVMFPMLCVLGMLLFCMVFNLMWLSQNKYHTQLMLDAASRAGTQAVDYYYGVKERTGHGYGNYHVYIELDPDEADAKAQAVIDTYLPEISGFTLTEVEFNPEDTVSPVWNSRKFQYDDKVISSEKQYQNGNFTVKIKGELDTVGANMYGGSDKIVVEQFSQSIARGTVTGID